MKRTTKRLITTITLSGLAAGTLTGCVSEAEIREVRDAAQALADRLDGPGGEALRAGIEDADRNLTSTDQHRIEDVANQIAPLVPAPVQAPLLLGVGLAASMLRAGQLKRALASVARGIEKAKMEDESFRDAFSRAVPTIRATQTPAAARIINETTHPHTKLRLPV